MDVVIVGLPGSGKSAVGRRLAARHAAAFIDLDLAIEREAGGSIPEIFAAEGEAGFRARERRAIEALGPPDRTSQVARVIAPGGGAILDPRNRWRLFHGRRAIWLDVRAEVLAQRLRHSPNVRPLVTSPDPLQAIRDLSVVRRRFYAAATRVGGVAEAASVVEAADAAVADRLGVGAGTVLLRAETPIGTIVLGASIATAEVAAALHGRGAGRAVVVSEPGAWDPVGAAMTAELASAGLPVERVLLPGGEAAKSLAVVEDAARQLARLRVERGEPIVAVGGGALTDVAGFLAATYLRGIPVIHVPTTLVGQIDAAIGGKTAVDVPEGKNLIGAFHQPLAVIIDIDLLGTLPERQRRAALGEAAKVAALGEERLFALLEADGPAVAAGDATATESGVLAELVERAAWAKIEVVVSDEQEAGGRIALNLGHSLGHALEAAAGYAGLLHGEAVAYGLRAACRIGVERGVTPPERANRIERLLDTLALAQEPVDLPIDAVLAALSMDKKYRDGHLRWVLPTADGHAIDADVPADLVRRVAAAVMAGRTAVALEVGR